MNAETYAPFLKRLYQEAEGDEDSTNATVWRRQELQMLRDGENGTICGREEALTFMERMMEQLDMKRAVEEALKNEIVKRVALDFGFAEKEIIVAAIVFLVLLCLCPIIIFSIYKMTYSIQVSASSVL